MLTQWEYIDLLKKQGGFIIVFCLSAIVTSLALTYVFSERYEAGTTIFYRGQEVTRLKAQDSEAFGSPVPAPPFKVIGNTLQEVVNNQSLLEEVVRNLRLDVPVPKVYDGPWYIDYYEISKDWLKQFGSDVWTIMKFGRLAEKEPVVGAVEELRKNINIYNEESYVFLISVRDKSPERAAIIVDEIVQTLVRWLRAQEQEPAAQRRVQLEILALEKLAEIEGYQSDIENLLITHNVASVSEEINRGMERLSDLEENRVKLLSDIEGKGVALQLVRDKLALKKSGGSDGRIQPGDFKRLASDEVFLDIELRGLKAHYATLRGEVNRLRARLQRLPSIQLLLDRSRNELDAANRQYTLLSDSLQEAVVRESEVLSEIKVLHAAVVPVTPVTPIKVYHVALAAALALVVSIGLVYMLTYFNIRVLFPSLGVRGRRLPPKPPNDLREMTAALKVEGERHLGE